MGMIGLRRQIEPSLTVDVSEVKLATESMLKGEPTPEVDHAGKTDIRGRT